MKLCVVGFCLAVQWLESSPNMGEAQGGVSSLQDSEPF